MNDEASALCGKGGKFFKADPVRIVRAVRRPAVNDGGNLITERKAEHGFKNGYLLSESGNRIVGVYSDFADRAETWIGSETVKYGWLVLKAVRFMRMNSGGEKCSGVTAGKFAHRQRIFITSRAYEQETDARLLCAADDLMIILLLRKMQMCVKQFHINPDSLYLINYTLFHENQLEKPGK